jgi:hypothetical protein
MDFESKIKEATNGNTFPSDSQSYGLWGDGRAPEDNFDQALPYSLVLVTQIDDGSLIKIPTNSSVRLGLQDFQLPIPPQSMQITAHFANKLQATQNGVFQTNNGIVFQHIQLSGTTGVFPLRGSTGNSNAIDNQNFDGVLAGTINTINTALNPTAQSIVKTIELERVDALAYHGTGFYQFLILRKWFESYSELKKKEEWKNVFLGLEIAKESIIYVCEPERDGFSFQRSESSPLEYVYRISLKSWSKINSDFQKKEKKELPLRTPAKLFEMLNSISQVRGAMETGANVLQAFRGDFNRTILEPIKQTSLLLKDALGLAISASDLPASLILDLRESLLEYSFLAGLTENLAVAYSSFSVKTLKAFQELQNIYQKKEIGSSRTGKGQLGENPFDRASAANAETLLRDYNFLSGIKVDSLPLNPEVRLKIGNSIKKSREEAFDFSKKIKETENFLFELEKTLGLIEGATATRSPTSTDYNLIGSISNLIQVYLELKAVFEKQKDNVFLQYINLPSASAENIQQAQSKFLVPFELDSTLEQMSQKYLGDPRKWIEIAILNNLQSPYIDEEGIRLEVIGKGYENFLTVQNDKNLKLGSQVWIFSENEKTTLTTCKNIKVLANQMEIQFDSNLNAEKYSQNNSAYIKFYLPNTTNSKKSIFIPSQNVVTQKNFIVDSNSQIALEEALIRIGGIDLSLDSKGDLEYSRLGDFVDSAGLKNIIQKIKVFIQTTLGSIILHSEIGNPIEIGKSIADFRISDIVKSANSFFQDNETFEKIENLKIIQNGPIIQVTINVKIVGLSKLIPITFSIQK